MTPDDLTYYTTRISAIAAEATSELSPAHQAEVVQLAAQARAAGLLPALEAWLDAETERRHMEAIRETHEADEYEADCRRLIDLMERHGARTTGDLIDALREEHEFVARFLRQVAG